MIIWNLQKISPNKWSESSLSQYDYKKLAEKLILKYGGRQKFTILKDPDAVDYIHTFLLFSAINYRGNKGWSLYTFLCKRTKFAIQKLKFKKLKERKFKFLYEDSKYYNDDQLDNLIKKEEYQELLNLLYTAGGNSSLFLIDYYNGVTIQEMCLKYNTNPQNIYNTIKYGIKKIKQFSKM